MSLLFSRQCEYALQAMLYLALKPDGEMVSIKEMTSRLGVPYHFVAKIFQELSRKGLLKSLKGPRGGFTFARSSRDITIFDVVETIDGPSFSTGCVMGFPSCDGKHPCAVHREWGSLREQFVRELSGRSLNDFAKEMRRRPYRDSVPGGTRRKPHVNVVL